MIQRAEIVGILFSSCESITFELHVNASVDCNDPPGLPVCKTSMGIRLFPGTINVITFNLYMLLVVIAFKNFFKVLMT